MKKIIPLVLVGMLMFGTATNAFAKGIDKNNHVVKVYMSVTDPDDPDPK